MVVVTHQAEKIWTSSSPVVSALGSESAPSRTTQVLVLAGARRCALETCGKKKLRAPLLGLDKSKYNSLLILSVRQDRMPPKLTYGNHVMSLGKAISAFVSRLVHSL